VLELADPALRDLVERNRVDEMQLLAPGALEGDEIRLVQNLQVLRGGQAFR